MKALFLTLFLSAQIIANAKSFSADTLSFWHVFYNKIKVKEYNGHNMHEILVFKTTNIKKEDSITVAYFRDTPCHDCPTKLIVEDEKHYIVTIGSDKGTFTPISVSATKLLIYKKKYNTNYFDVYFYEENRRKLFLFRIKLE
ncbi:hypothetical protein AD998_12560 [bacterium 336/3]|nr:hypothetical protein AD998_12560 [bacterium 336/3]